MNRIIQGDWIEVAETIPDKSVHCIITSPPYWSQRDYGTDGQLGLEKTFQEHIEKLVTGFREMKRILRDDGIMWLNYGDKYVGGGNGGGGKQDTNKGSLSARTATGLPQGNLIGLAWRLALALQADGWILRSDVIWAKGISFCDVYSGSCMPESVNGTRWQRCRVKVKSGWGEDRPHPSKGVSGKGRIENSGGKFAAQAQWQDCPGCDKCRDNGGYVLRRGSWRPTRGHEYVFQFVKQVPYFADMEAVREESSGVGGGACFGSQDEAAIEAGAQSRQYDRPDYTTRNIRDTWAIENIEELWDAFVLAHKEELVRRCLEWADHGELIDVWAFNPQAYAGAHFATFPTALVVPMIKVSTSQKGVCPECGCQWARVIEKIDTGQTQKMPDGFATHEGDHGSIHRDGREKGEQGKPVLEPKTIGWRPTCSCGCKETVPAIVYDPFTGSGTVAAEAARMGRNYLGSEINTEYIEQAETRIHRAETGLTKQEIINGQRALFRAE